MLSLTLRNGLYHSSMLYIGRRPSVRGGPCSFENQPTTGTTLLCMAAAEVNQHKAAHAESSTPLAESQYRDILNEYGPLLIFT
jgi:hypothetical protein